MSARDGDAPPAWLLRELIIWRGLALLGLLILAGANWVDQRAERARLIEDRKAHALEAAERAEDNRQRAAHWARLEAGLATNGENILRLDDALRGCLICHAHPNIDEVLKQARAAREKARPRTKN